MNSTKTRLAEIHGNMKISQASWFNAIWMGGFHGFTSFYPWSIPKFWFIGNFGLLDGTSHWELTITRAPIPMYTIVIAPTPDIIHQVFLLHQVSYNST